MDGSTSVRSEVAFLSLESMAVDTSCWGGEQPWGDLLPSRLVCVASQKHLGGGHCETGCCVRWIFGWIVYVVVWVFGGGALVACLVGTWPPQRES